MVLYSFIFLVYLITSWAGSDIILVCAYALEVLGNPDTFVK